MIENDDNVCPMFWQIALYVREVVGLGCTTLANIVAISLLDKCLGHLMLVQQAEGWMFESQPLQT